MSPEPESICILDDDASVRHSIEQLLDSDGLKAQSFEDAEVFFAHARSHAVPLALLDVWMPETNGLQVQARLRDVSPDTKVIVMTGREPPAPLCWKARYNDEAVIREKLTIESFAARMPRSASSGMLG